MNVHKGWACPRGIYSEVHSPITTPEIICVMALTLQPIRGCPQHSRETGTRLSSAIHRRLLSRFFLREGGRLYTGYLIWVSPSWFLSSYHQLPKTSLQLHSEHQNNNHSTDFPDFTGQDIIKFHRASRRIRPQVRTLTFYPIPTDVKAKL